MPSWRPRGRGHFAALALSVVAAGLLVVGGVVIWRSWGLTPSEWSEAEQADAALGLLGAAVGLLGVVIAFLAWRRPRSPGHDQSLASTAGLERLLDHFSSGRQEGATAGAGAAGPATGASLAAPIRSLPAQVRGRDDVLRELRQAVHRPAGQVHVLVGLGGVGKSTVALELCRWAHRHDGHAAWWISAKDTDSLTEGLVSLAEELGANYAVRGAIRAGEGRACDRVWELLERTPPKWLLVFDNADDPQILGPVDGSGWLRASDRGLVLVTSRIHQGHQAEQWGRDAKVHRIDALPEPAAARVLLDMAPEGGGDAEARALARRLGRLPLALQLAGTNVGSEFARWASFTAYQQALDTDGIAHALTADPGIGQDTNPRALVMRTWELSLDSLATHGLPQARPLLRLLSCYAATAPIPVTLLQAPEIGALDSPDQTADRHNLQRWVNQALRGLAMLNLIVEHQRPAKGRRQPALVVHPLVAEVNRAHLNGLAQTTSPPDAATIRRTAVELLAAAIDPLRWDDNRHWPIFEPLTPHVRELLGSTAERLEADPLARLLTTTARTAAFHVWSGAERAGERLANAALKHAGRLGMDHPARLHLRTELAWAIGRNGRWEQAEPVLREIVETRIRILGTEHADTLDTRHKFAWAVGKLGDWKTAEKLLSTILDLRGRILGAEHIDTLHTWCCHAWATSQCGGLADAVRSYRDLLAVRARVLGEDHVDTLDTRHSLAEALVRHGRYRDAEQLLREIITARDRILGPDHPETLDNRPRFWLGRALRGQGRRREANRVFRRLLKDQTSALGADHLATDATRRELRS